jgi:rhodanese-related sulfurtransferase
MRGISKWLFSVIAILGLSAQIVCAAGEKQTNTKPENFLEPKDAYALIQKNRNNPDFVALDVRTPDEFKDGHIEGAINVDYNSGGFRTELSQLVKNRTYLTYCRTGRRSDDAVHIMRSMGFERIIRIKGDILGWKSQKLPVVK